MANRMSDIVVRLKNGMYWFDPANPKTQDHVSNVVKDIVKDMILMLFTLMIIFIHMLLITKELTSRIMQPGALIKIAAELYQEQTGGETT